MSEKFGKREWTDLFRPCGLSNEEMMQWHRKFENKHPEAHQSFLQWLGIDAAEIETIRSKSR